MNGNGSPEIPPTVLAREKEFIGTVIGTYPEFSDIRYFRRGGMHDNGLAIFRWKFDYDRILQIGWIGTELAVRQYLSIGGSESAITLPVTWRGGAERIPFDGNGEAMLTGSAAHELWCEATGQRNAGNRP